MKILKTFGNDDGLEGELIKNDQNLSNSLRSQQTPEPGLLKILIQDKNLDEAEEILER